MLGRSLSVLLLAAACHGSPPPQPPPTGVHANPPSVAADAPAEPTAGSDAVGPALHEKCGASDACAAPGKCAHYYGIAGKRGPEFTTCEITCKEDADCPVEHRHCAVVADGPGQTCR